MWRIYYDDDSTFDWKDGEPHEAPALGFICCVAYDRDGNRYVMNGWDHYCYDLESGQWWGMDLCGLFDRLIRNKVYAYKQGRTVTSVKFREIMDRACFDPEFPR